MGCYLAAVPAGASRAARAAANPTGPGGLTRAWCRADPGLDHRSAQAAPGWACLARPEPAGPGRPGCLPPARAGPGQPEPVPGRPQAVRARPEPEPGPVLRPPGLLACGHRAGPVPQRPAPPEPGPRPASAPRAWLPCRPVAGRRCPVPPVRPGARVLPVGPTVRPVP